MEANRYLELLRLDGDGLAAAAERDLTARVPSCPEWDVAELVRHTGQVFRHKTAIVRRGGTGYPKDVEKEDGPSDDEVLGWYRDALDDLIETLASKDPEAPAWSWAGDHRVAFWNRRMAQEATVHRWDAENAVGDAGPIDAELAADGIDEFLGRFIPGDEIPYEGRPGTVNLHCTDVPGEWTVSLEAGRVPTYEGGHSKGDAAVRGSAEDLLLFVWRRIAPERVEVLGDGELVVDFWDYARGPGQ